MVFLVFGEVFTICALNSWRPAQPLHAHLWVDRLPSRNGNNARTLHFRAESLWFFLVAVSVFSSTSSHWSLISCVLLSPRRFGSLGAQVGLGFAVVGWFRPVRLPPPLLWSWSVSVGLRFYFPLPCQGSPALGQVCWCWCFLLPSPFAFPLFVSRISNFHLIFMFTFASFLSSSFSSHRPDLNLPDLNSSPAPWGVSAERLNRR